MATCEYKECGKKLPKKARGKGRPQRFCDSKCSMAQWRLDHPYKPVYREA